MEAANIGDSITTFENGAARDASSRGQADGSITPSTNSRRVPAKATTRAAKRAEVESTEPLHYLGAYQTITKAAREHGGMTLTFKTVWHEGRPFIRILLADSMICQKCQNWCPGDKCGNPNCDWYGIAQKPEMAEKPE